MRREKLILESSILGRSFHADVFSSDRAPEATVLLFGGSGVDRKEYERRAKSINPTFDPAFKALESDSAFLLFFVTAPYDVPFADFEDFPEEAERWNQHVAQDLLCLRPQLPFYLIGYSGGMALALNGLQEHPRCIGVGGLGADGFPGDPNEGERWGEPIRLYYNRADPVLERNRAVIDRLEGSGMAGCWRQQTAGHELRDYVANGSFSGLIRRAAVISQRRSPSEG
jgi:pimeloyl-ACP methyl ester carboxylesterase